MLWAGAPPPAARAAAATEPQVKAVFLFNFSHFVAWPEEAFATPAQPFVIGVLGSREIAEQLERAIRGENVEGRALEVRRYDRPEEVGGCQILFIDHSHAASLERILPRLQAGHTLTVSDLDDAARRGVMIQMVNDRSRIRLLINLERAQAAGLSISSNLLRPAEIVGSAN
jgi:hypothetical protein